MTIDEASRRELWTSLRNTLGDAQADTLMTMLPAEPLPELATRADLDVAMTTLRAEMRAEFAEVRAEMGALEGSLRSEFGELRAEIARQMLTLGLTLGSLIVAVLGTILTLGFTGAFG